jgi:hypothetical protein
VRNDLPSEFNPYQMPSGRSEAFWRTLITDRSASYPPKHPVGGGFEGRFEAWMGRGEQLDDEAYVRPYSDAAIYKLPIQVFCYDTKRISGSGP